MLGDRSIKDTIFSLGLENFLRIFLGAGASILVGRHLGPEDYGKFNYVISLVLIFSPLINFSMNEVIVKELVQEDSADDLIFRDALGLRVFLGILGVLLCLIFTYFYAQGSGVFEVVLVYAFFFFLKSFDVIEYFFIAKSQIKLISYPRSIVFILTNVLKVVAVFLNQDWRWFVYISCFELLGVFFLCFFKSKKEKWLNFKIRLGGKHQKNLFLKSFPFFLITLLTILFTRADHLMIWRFLGERLLGEYSIVTRWGEFLNFIPLLLTSAFLPKIVGDLKHGNLEDSKSLKLFFKLVFITSLCISLFFLVLGPTFLKILYGDSYQVAPQIIQYYCFQIALSFFYMVLVRYLLVVDNMNAAIVLYGIALLLNLLFNMIAIPRYGVVGAIWSSIFSYFLSLVISFVFIKDVRKGTVTYLKCLV